MSVKRFENNENEINHCAYLREAIYNMQRRLCHGSGRLAAQVTTSCKCFISEFK